MHTLKQLSLLIGGPDRAADDIPSMWSRIEQAGQVVSIGYEIHDDQRLECYVIENGHVVSSVYLIAADEPNAFTVTDADAQEEMEAWLQNTRELDAPRGQISGMNQDGTVF